MTAGRGVPRPAARPDRRDFHGQPRKTRTAEASTVEMNLSRLAFKGQHRRQLAIDYRVRIRTCEYGFAHQRGAHAFVKPLVIDTQAVAMHTGESPEDRRADACRLDEVSIEHLDANARN